MAYVVDLRSDTVTKPTEAMKRAMLTCELGDDVFREDPTVNSLEAKISAMLGKENALFVPSGTMANLIAVLVHCDRRGAEAFVGSKSHIYKYELGGVSHLGGVLLSTLETKPDGTFDLAELERRIRGSDIHEPVSTLVAIENTQNYCGGKVLPLPWLEELGAMCRERSIALHMDGARLFNASAHLRRPAAQLAAHCDSVSVCFSKGLSAPVGSALVGSQDFIERARRIRKMLGGGMRQAGVLAAAAIVALDEVVPLLHLDHTRARRLAEVIHGLFLKTFSVDVAGQHTNIVLVRIAPTSPVTAGQVVTRLEQVLPAETQGDCKTVDDKGIIVKSIQFNDKTLRLTLHREITDEDLWLVIRKVTYVFKEMDAAAAQ